MGRIQDGPTLLAGIGDTRLGQTGRTHSGTGGTNVKARDAIFTFFVEIATSPVPLKANTIIFLCHFFVDTVGEHSPSPRPETGHEKQVGVRE